MLHIDVKHELKKSTLLQLHHPSNCTAHVGSKTLPVTAACSYEQKST